MIELGQIELDNRILSKGDCRRTGWIIISGDLTLFGFLCFVVLDVREPFEFASATGVFRIVSAEMKEFRDRRSVASNEDEVGFQ